MPFWSKSPTLDRHALFRPCKWIRLNYMCKLSGLIQHSDWPCFAWCRRSTTESGAHWKRSPHWVCPVQSSTRACTAFHQGLGATAGCWTKFSWQSSLIRFSYSPLNYRNLRASLGQILYYRCSAGSWVSCAPCSRTATRCSRRTRSTTLSRFWWVEAGFDARRVPFWSGSTSLFGQSAWICSK